MNFTMKKNNIKITIQIKKLNFLGNLYSGTPKKEFLMKKIIAFYRHYYGPLFDCGGRKRLKVRIRKL